MTVSDFIEGARRSLSAAQIESARLDALVLLEFITGKGRAWLLAHPDAKLGANTLNRYQDLIKKRTQRVPVAYLTGMKEFYGLKFKVTPDVLIPRPETEALVDLALHQGVPQTKEVLDIGTGCGAIAVAVAKNRPQWVITATDISPAAIKIARHNAKQHKVKIKFIVSNLLRESALQRRRYDIITANLPYIRKEKNILSPEAEHEPAIAFYGGSDGLDIYRHLFGQAPKYLKPGGYIIIEADRQQHQSLVRLARLHNLNPEKQLGFVLAFSVGLGEVR